MAIKKVVWKTGETPAKNVLPPPMMRQRGSKKGGEDIDSESFKIGSLWFLAKNANHTESNEEGLSYLTPAVRGSNVFSIIAKTSAIYLGVTRVTESKRDGSICRNLKHVFMINGMRLMVDNSLISLFRPA